MSNISCRVAALILCLGVNTPLMADEGNGVGNAFLTATSFRIGGTATVTWGDPNLPFAQTALVISDNLGPSVFPSLGMLCIDINSPNFQVLVTGLTGPNGLATQSAAIPNIPSLVSLAPVYLLAVVVDFSLASPFVSIPKTLPVYFENSDSYTPAATALGAPRALHTATSLALTPTSNRTKIFVAGGGAGSILAPVASDSTEVYNPLTRTSTAGPVMNTTRALHQSVLLNDGRVLIIGGVESNANCTATCQIYDPATNTLSMAAPMSSPRAGHMATKLANGSVLVTGGVTTFVGGTTNLPAVLNTALTTGEVYNPATNLWTAVSNVMASRRFGHGQILLNNGNVLVAGGISGGTTVFGQGVPTYTTSCALYNPVTNAFSVTGSMSGGRAGFGVSVLPNGNVLATGGIVAGLLSIPTASNTCQVFNGAAWSTAGVATLPTGIALHTQSTHPVSGAAILHGGITGTFLALGSTANAGVHNGATYSALTSIGVNAGIPGSMPIPSGSHTATPMYDGSLVILGGSDGTNVNAGGYIYTPTP